MQFSTNRELPARRSMLRASVKLALSLATSIQSISRNKKAVVSHTPTASASGLIPGFSTVPVNNPQHTMGTNAENGQVVSTVNDWGHLGQTIESQRASAPYYAGHCISLGLKKFENSRSVQFVGSPASEQSAHHAADQATWTAATAVMVSTTPAATTGQIGVIGLV